MKRFVKPAALFLVGFVVGGSIIGYFSLTYARDTIKQTVRDFTLSQISLDITLLESYRNRDADRFFKSVEDGIPGYVLMIDKNEEMKRSNGRQVLKAAKSFYVCTKTPVPKNIEKIIEKVELSADLRCLEN